LCQTSGGKGSAGKVGSFMLSPFQRERKYSGRRGSKREELHKFLAGKGNLDLKTERMNWFHNMRKS